MNINFSGLNQINTDLLNYKKIKPIPLTDLFDDDFMIKYTDFLCIEEFLKTSSIDFSTILRIDMEKLDNFVQQSSTFNSWDEMHKKSIAIHLD